MKQRAMVILDGGMGRELQRSGAPFRQPEWSALALSEAPEAVVGVHAAFIAAGARTVVANLWAADDTFSLALVREFYRQLASGADVADALRKAKQHMLKSFGPNATPRLWSGMLAYGDGRGVLTRPAVVSQAKRQ